MSLAVVILTGLSGAGKTVALRALEDCGFFCTDNLPLPLINEFLKISSASGFTSIAIGIDIREKDFLQDIEETVRRLKSAFNVEIVFLEADADSLLRRFKETRRPHPLANQFSVDLKSSLKDEIAILKPLRDLADRVIDTTPFSPHQLRDAITIHYCAVRKETMNIILTSFGYKFGVPGHADLVFDVRFLPNPHYVPDLKPRTGLDPAVRDFVFADGAARTFLGKIRHLLDYLIPLYIKEGKSYLNICIGCTGGRHRSVALVEDLAKDLKASYGDIDLIHREL